MNEWNISRIEALTEDEAKELAVDTLTYKVFEIYFVDFGDYFGYSMLVFSNGRHIYYANDYELHHSKGKTPAELWPLYMNTLKSRLFAPDDFNVVESYQDFLKKEYCIRNYYPMRYDHESIFGINKSRDTDYKFYSPICFAHFKSKEEMDFVNACYIRLTMANKKASENSFEYWKAAFRYEMGNHEYFINLDGDWDVLGCFGNISRSQSATIDDWFKELGFGDMHKRAYLEARKEHYAAFDN